MVSPAWPSARVMCSPFSAREWVIRRDASSTCSATSSLIWEISWVRSRWTLLMASRICPAWPTRVSRWLPRSCSSAADAHLVVVVGMFEGGDLVLHQRLELGGARERALDAVAHGGDFAADRLADGDDQFARDGLGLGQPHGDLGHGLGDQPQFLRAPRHVGQHIEEDDRHEEDDAEHGQHRCRQAGRSERGLQLRQIHPAEHEPGQHPGDGEDGRDDVGRVRRATLQRAQNLADGFAIVVGRAARRACSSGWRGSSGCGLFGSGVAERTARHSGSEPAPRAAWPARRWMAAPPPQRRAPASRRRAEAIHARSRAHPGSPKAPLPSGP